MQLNTFNIGMSRLWLPQKILLIINSAIRRINETDKRKLLMRVNLIVVILTTLLMQVSASSLAQRLTYVKKGATLEEIFKEIQKQTGYNIFYSDKKINDTRKIDANFKNAALTDVLNTCAELQSLEYTIDDKNIFIKPKAPSLLDKLSSTVSNLVRDLTVKGRVVDEQGKPLPNASIRVKGKNVVTNTDKNGMFVLANVPDDGVLVISYVGYKTLEIPVKDAVMPLEIRLNIQTGELEEVKVDYSTGYQLLNKERATGSFAYIDNKLFNRSVGANVLDRILSVTSGLLSVNAGTPNPLDNISIRGVSTINASKNPLLVVDNFIYEGNINDLNPNDVESVTVLKDAAAASIWGVRAGNGVIVVSTKKGKFNQATSIGFNSNITIGQKPDLSYIPSIPSKDIVAFEKQRFADSLYNDFDDVYPSYPYLPAIPMVAEVLLAARRAGIVNPLSDPGVKAQLALYENHDVRDDIRKYMLQNSISQQYALNVSGGGSNYKYYTSVGYDKSRPNDIGKTSDRLTLRFNNVWNPLKNLDLSAEIVWGRSNEKKTSKIDYQGDFSVVLQSPYTRLVDESLNPVAVPYQYRLRYVDTVNASGLLDWHYRPLDEMKNGNEILNSTNTTINTGMAYTIIQGLKVNINYQWQKTISEYKEKASVSLFETRDLINQFVTTDPSTGLPIYPYPLGSVFSSSNNSNSSWNVRGKVNFDKNWSKHSLTTLAGWEVRQVNSYRVDNQPLFGFIEDTNIGQLPLYGDWVTRPNGYQQNITPQLTGLPKELLYRFGSYFANAAYSFNNTYSFNASTRIDESNFFGVEANNRKVPLWSTGVAWNISRENFYKISWLSELKLRVTYGYSGNTNAGTSPFARIQLYPARPGQISVTPYSQLISPPNPQLRWERIKNINFGIDFSIKNSQLTGSIDFYRKQGLDLISQISVDPTSGFNTYIGNDASIEGKGIDITLNSRNMESENIKWNTYFLFSISKEKVTTYDVKPPDSYSAYTAGEAIIIGKPLSNLYSLKWAGLDPSNGDSRLFISGEVKGSADLDKVRFHDLVNNGRKVPAIFGAFRNEFSWNNFSLSINVVYRLGYFFRRDSFSGNLTNGSSFQHTDYLNAWKQPGDELQTSVPGYREFYTDLRYGVYRVADILVEKGDHIRLQDIRMSFNLNNKIVKILPFNTLQVYLYANNLGVLWRANKKGLDPDAYGFGAMPAPKNFSLGMNFNF